MTPSRKSGKAGRAKNALIFVELVTGQWSLNSFGKNGLKVADDNNHATRETLRLLNTGPLGPRI
jgi:hypothetical protein